MNTPPYRAALVCAGVLSLYALVYATLLILANGAHRPSLITVSLLLMAIIPGIALTAILRLRRRCFAGEPYPRPQRKTALALSLLLLIPTLFWGAVGLWFIGWAIWSATPSDLLRSMQLVIMTIFLYALPLALGPAILSGLLAKMFFVHGRGAK